MTKRSSDAFSFRVQSPVSSGTRTTTGSLMRFASSRRGSSFPPERLVHLFLDAAEILAQHLLLFFRQEPERHAQHALGELDVHPVLPVLRAARDVEIELAHTRAIARDFGFVPRHGARAEVREKPEAVHAMRPWRKVIDRVALYLQAIVQSLHFRLVLTVLFDRRER